MWTLANNHGITRMALLSQMPPAFQKPTACYLIFRDNNPTHCCICLKHAEKHVTNTIMNATRK